MASFFFHNPCEARISLRAPPALTVPLTCGTMVGRKAPEGAVWERIGSMAHAFTGKWITDEEFFRLPPRSVFHRQLDEVDLPCDEHRDRHILFRKTFVLSALPEKATVYCSADDYYKLYINGRFVAQGPAPSYHFRYNYNVVEVGAFLREGENLIAVHTLYQGLINRVWQSGDNRHGLILDLVADGRTLVKSDESFLTRRHSGYEETGICGYQTQFLERYDSGAPEVGFADPAYSDGDWSPAKISEVDDHTLVGQASASLVFERIAPVNAEASGSGAVYDFGSNYVGYLCATVRGKKGDVVTVRCAQELNEDGSLRWQLRANCAYEEEWLLADGESTLDWFDYKSFRYAELIFPEGTKIEEVYLLARHYPFTLRAALKPEYAGDPDLRAVWELCVHTQEYGVQEVIQETADTGWETQGNILQENSYDGVTLLLLQYFDGKLY